MIQACPTSSVFTNSQSLESHAIKRWALDGTSFSLNTDDPGVIGGDLQTEFKVASEVGLEKPHIVQSVSENLSLSLPYSSPPLPSFPPMYPVPLPLSLLSPFPPIALPSFFPPSRVNVIIICHAGAEWSCSCFPP